MKFLEQTGKTTLIDGIREGFTKSVVQSQTKAEKLRIQSLDPERITVRQIQTINITANNSNNYETMLYRCSSRIIIYLIVCSSKNRLQRESTPNPIFT